MNSFLYIFGCGGHARSIINSLKALEIERNCVLVDDSCDNYEQILGCRTMREKEFWESYCHENFEFMVGVGNNQNRKKLYDRAVSRGGVPQKLLSVSSMLGLETKIGEGSFIAEKTYLGPEAAIGIDSIVNTGCVIEHETKIGDHTHCAPNSVICGRCNIGNNVFLGAGSTIIDKITVVDDVVIGAGSVVVQNILQKGTYVGCPARMIHI